MTKATLLSLLILLCTFHGVCAQSVPNAVDLDNIRRAAEQANSDAVIILHDGEPVLEWYAEEDVPPIEIMSVMKSVAAIGIGRLLHLGLLDSLDQPVHTIYPEWRQGRKQDITIRHLLNHTSGLQNVQNANAEIYPSPNAVRLALAAELSEEPGSAIRYNNKATNLLSGIIEETYGQRMDQFFVKEIFRPMRIYEYGWRYDESGTPHAMAGLRLKARDLAKFGQLVLDEGMWEGEQLLSASYIDEMLAQGQPHYQLSGLLWWRLPSPDEPTQYILDENRMAELSAAGIAAEDLARIRPFVGQTFTARADRNEAMKRAFGEDWEKVLDERFQGTGIEPVFRREYGDIVAYYGDGYLGQTLMVIPEKRVVAVRQVRGDQEYDPETDGFGNFKELVLNAFGITKGD
jgi:CubicO group peptidase (beta-lactamase class C family)